MKSAKRLFEKQNKSKEETHPTSVFCSKLPRGSLSASGGTAVGPGEYNIALPLVRPRFQAIRKNNNTLIVKVNEKLSPFFQSLEPRFHEPKAKSTVNHGEKTLYALAPKAADGFQRQQKISLGMKSRLRRLAEIINLDEARRARIKSNSALETLDQSQEVANSLKLYRKERERLHFLLKNMKKSRQSPGAQWSKYRETKGNLYRASQVPGPGTYQNSLLLATNRYSPPSEEHSWQFKSLTKRNSFGNFDDKQYEVIPTKSHFINQIDGRFYKVESISLLREDDEEQEKSVTNE